ncbi:MAG: hypothetical protein NXI18_11070 [Alphaproteobacteria bacterium]|nr:hypothetical protein [Alphaproteobacteria bacterium]
MLLLSPHSSAAGGLGSRADTASVALPLIRHIGMENSGIERDPVLRRVLERFLGDARDDILTPGGRTVETVLAAIARPAPVPPQFVRSRRALALWGCGAPDCRVKAAVVLGLANNAACVILHRAALRPSDPATVVPDPNEPATATFHAEIFRSPAHSDDGSVLPACRYELLAASQRARPQGYRLVRGTITVRPGPLFRPDPVLSAAAEIWDGHDPNL